MTEKPEAEEFKTGLNFSSATINDPDQLHNIFSKLDFSYSGDDSDENCVDWKEKTICKVFAEIKDDT
jgi:hypothetical protein